MPPPGVGMRAIGVHISANANHYTGYACEAPEGLRIDNSLWVFLLRI
jgi:hypothetical protein